MLRILAASTLALLCTACGGGIDSYEDGMNAQVDVMEDMVNVLEGVTDEASAKAAVPEIEALGKRLAEIAAAMQKLPQPAMDELAAMAQEMAEKGREYQARAGEQMMKISRYPELAEAFTSAMAGVGQG